MIRQTIASTLYSLGNEMSQASGWLPGTRGKYIVTGALAHIRQAGRIRDIRSLNAVILGFIAVNGFEKQEDGFSYYSGEDLYL